MILHLITDDKFADYAINQFLEIDDTSRFLLVKSTVNEEIKNIKNVDKIIHIVANSNEYINFLKQLNSYNAVIIHGFFYSWQEEIILSLPTHIRVAWVCWGGEIYSRKPLFYNFLAQKTKFVYWLKQLKRTLKGKPLLDKDFSVKLETFRRINFCLSDMPDEYAFVNHFCKSSMQYSWYNYYSIEETLGELKAQKINGSNILIGNSCTLENNHIDIFYSLKKMNMQARKVIVPLSYGADWLQIILKNKGENIFNQNFHPLFNFMERNEYNQILISCSIMIMNHYRPQAQGNIITGLWLGAKVYLSNKSLTYSYFKGLGIFVYSIEDDLKPNNKHALQALEDDKVEHNREILMREYGRENMMVRIREIVRVLNN